MDIANYRAPSFATEQKDDGHLTDQEMGDAENKKEAENIPTKAKSKVTDSQPKKRSRTKDSNERASLSPPAKTKKVASRKKGVVATKVN